MAGEGGGDVEGEDGVAALGGAVLDDIFPLFSVVVFLCFGPGIASREIDCARICRPGKCVHLFLALGERDCFAAGGRNHVDPAYFSFVVIFVFILVFVFVITGIGIFLGSRLAFGAEGDPAAVGGPFGIDVMSRLSELD